jgi:hypothetical protein
MLILILNFYCQYISKIISICYSKEILTNCLTYFKCDGKHYIISSETEQLVPLDITKNRKQIKLGGKKHKELYIRNPKP